MITGRVILNSTRCANCRFSLLNAFVSASGIPIRPISIPSSKRSPLANHAWRRGFAQSRWHLSEASRSKIETLAEEEAQESEENIDLDNAPQPADSTPWYLQIHPPERESNTLLSRQQLPELPLDPPPLLQPMLEHIFKELGLDDLTLFDLRMIDPPPALGANLLMVIGTARSEKHLHVSADRFCRWMKTEHQIAPYADGLLGRGELKLKLRRKARRARILSRVGSSEINNTDDGIRTGWICVTVDNIEDGRPIAGVERASDDFVGFGGEEGGAKVVVQMLTQEKREELDLEELWGRTMARYERKEKRISNDQEDAALRQEVGQRPLHKMHQRSDFPSITSSSSPSPGLNHSQIRHMHSQALSQLRWFSTSRRTSSGEPTFESGSSGNQVSQEATQSTVAHDFLVLLPFEHDKNVRDHGQGPAETSRLRAHVDFLKSLSPEDGRSILGHGAMDADSTPFLKSFHDSLPLFPAAHHWESRLNLICHSITLGVPGYEKKHLESFFRQMQASLVEIPAAIYMLSIRAFLTPSPTDRDGESASLSTTSLYSAASLLEDMNFRGHDIATDEIRSLLETAVIQAQHDTAPPKLHVNAPHRLRRLLDQVFGQIPSMELEFRKLHACADAGNWQGVWDIWHGFARDMRPRPAELYIAILHRIAELGHQAKILEALRVLVPEMDREEPPVQMDRDIAEAVKQCLRVVDPKIEEDAKEMYSEDGPAQDEQELHRLWLRCERVLQTENRFLREYDDD